MFTTTKIAAKNGVSPSGSGAAPRTGRGTNALSRKSGRPRKRRKPSPSAETARSPRRTATGRPNDGGPSCARASFRFMSQTKKKYWIEWSAGIT
jgi:hypothetical protein